MASLTAVRQGARRDGGHDRPSGRSQQHYGPQASNGTRGPPRSRGGSAVRRGLGARALIVPPSSVTCGVTSHAGGSTTKQKQVPIVPGTLPLSLDPPTEFV